ncbi:hypothetical protein CC86DRAFT_50548 [Ophiobolus disseminans]|uniref:Uncharacterized protein n=1 Tax=Ophiobolus disseminans TaxID=1469910 RepID=A0A6A6ZW18_9PLEO|nr:hypothetical protein CC86DRAFT_50548 [Ophiobolus disseminans]
MGRRYDAPLCVEFELAGHGNASTIRPFDKECEPDMHIDCMYQLYYRIQRTILVSPILASTHWYRESAYS